VKVGSVVNFFTTFKQAMRDYEFRNPGIIVAKQKIEGIVSEVSNSRESVYILWANGEMTREHASYLKVLNNENR